MVEKMVLAGIASVAGALVSPVASGEDVVIDTSTSRLWSTVTDSSVVLPVPWPQGASTATLVAPASGLFAGADVNLTKGVDASYALALPRPTRPDAEYVVSLTILFRNADGETLAPGLEASFGVVCDATYFRGIDTASSSWTNIKSKGSYTLPKPASETSCQTIYEGLAVTNAIPKGCAWTAFAPRKCGTYSLSLFREDGELSSSVMLDALSDGFMVLIR